MGSYSSSNAAVHIVFQGGGHLKQLIFLSFVCLIAPQRPSRFAILKCEFDTVNVSFQMVYTSDLKIKFHEDEIQKSDCNYPVFNLGQYGYYGSCNVPSYQIFLRTKIYIYFL